MKIDVGQAMRKQPQLPKELTFTTILTIHRRIQITVRNHMKVGKITYQRMLQEADETPGYMLMAS